MRFAAKSAEETLAPDADYKVFCILIPTLTKNENKKYDDSTLQRINGPVAFAAGFAGFVFVADALCGFEADAAFAAFSRAGGAGRPAAFAGALAGGADIAAVTTGVVGRSTNA